jgi:hypothetical protein
MSSRRGPVAPPPQFITVVTGYPRSGTSMLMQILAAGGLDVLIDDCKAPDEHNPKGYFEFGQALRLGREGETTDWLEAARGKAVKVIATQLQHLLPTYAYKVIFMRRNIAEVIASSLKLGATLLDSGLNERERVLAFKGEYVHYEIWLMQQPNMEAIYLNYNDILVSPEENLERVRRFLDLPLDLEGMAAAIDPSLYRQRADTIRLDRPGISLD